MLIIGNRKKEERIKKYHPETSTGNIFMYFFQSLLYIINIYEHFCKFVAMLCMCLHTVLYPVFLHNELHKHVKRMQNLPQSEFIVPIHLLLLDI
jgi:magnesium-transporting ATPase (P-type)